MTGKNLRVFDGLNRWGLAVVAIASLSANILLFALPLYSLQIYDRVLISRSVDTLWLLTLMVFLALVTGAIIDGLRARLLIRIANSYSAQLTPRLFDATLLQSARTADPNSQPFRDAATLSSFVSSPQGLTALFDAPLVPMFLMAVYLIHGGLGHVMLFGVIVLLVLAIANEILTSPALKAANTSALLAQHRIEGVMRNAEAAEAMGMRAALGGYWSQLQNDSMAKASKAGDRAAHLAAFAKGVRTILSLLISGAGAWYAIHDEITIGAMVAASIISARGLAPLETLIGAWKNLVTATEASARIKAVLAQSRQETSIQLPVPSGRLMLERVVFSPPGSDAPTIKAASLDLKAGTCLGLVGPSAAGKSTLARIICGVWQPLSGHVRLDGADIFSWDRTDFGRHCGYLPQDVELFAGSVRDNIARFTVTDDGLIIEAAQAAGCHEMILRLPFGYDTKVGAGGTALSSGQRQRIGLARALFGSPRLIVLDEPNSNLDMEGEQALIRSISQLREACVTVVLIAHRTAILGICDQIAVIVDGQIKRLGPRDEILGKLHALASTQQGSVA